MQDPLVGLVEEVERGGDGALDVVIVIAVGGKSAVTAVVVVVLLLLVLLGPLEVVAEMLRVRVVRQGGHHAAEVEGSLAGGLVTTWGRGRRGVRTAGVSVSVPATAATTVVEVWREGRRRRRRRWWMFTAGAPRKVEKGEWWWWWVVRTTVGVRALVVLLGTEVAAEHAEGSEGERGRAAVLTATTTAVPSLGTKAAGPAVTMTVTVATLAEAPGATVSSAAAVSSTVSLATILISVRDLLRRIRRVLVLHHGIGAVVLLLAARSTVLLLAVSLGGGSGVSDLIVTNVLGKILLALGAGAGAGAGTLVGAVLFGPVAVSTAATRATGVVVGAVGAVSPGAPAWRTLGPALGPAVPEVGVHEGRQLRRWRWRWAGVVDASAAGCVMFPVVHGFPEGIKLVWPGHIVVVVVCCDCCARWYCRGVCVCVCVKSDELLDDERMEWENVIEKHRGCNVDFIEKRWNATLHSRGRTPGGEPLRT